MIVTAIILALIALSIYTITCERREPDYPQVVAPSEETERLARWLAMLRKMRAIENISEKTTDRFDQVVQSLASRLTREEVRWAHEMSYSVNLEDSGPADHPQSDAKPSSHQ